MALAAWIAMAVLSTSAGAGAVRTVYFTAPAFKECYISVSNLSGAAQTLAWSISSGDGANTWVNAYAKQQEVPGVTGGGPICTSPCTTGLLKPGTTVQLGFVKYADAPGSFSGSLSITEAVGHAMASGYCVSDGVNVPFTIYGGHPF